MLITNPFLKILCVYYMPKQAAEQDRQIINEKSNSFMKKEELKENLKANGVDSIFSSLKETDTPVFLKSDMSHPWGRLNLLVWDPCMLYQIKNASIEIVSANQKATFDLDQILTAIPESIEQIRSEINSDLIAQFSDQNPEFWRTILESYLGIYGYLSYELGNYLDPFERQRQEQILPATLFYFPLKYCIETQNEWIYIELTPSNKHNGGQIYPNEENKTRKYYNTPKNIQQKVLYPSENFEDYCANIERIKNYIRAGDIYQINYTMHFTVPRTEAYHDLKTLFCAIFSNNPTPYAAFIQNSPFSILSHSMELFLEVIDGHVITRPIKGTRPRGRTLTEDQNNIAELIKSDKEQAELAMIVDLLRNDLARSCIPESVNVVKHAQVESFSNVHHLISTVEGIIDASPSQSWALLLRSFPGGSITGCPKLRAMEIINELESEPRGVYTGSIGHLSLNGNMRMNIVIRTLIADDTHIHFNAGGGIVYDSIPTEEYLECLHKVRHFTRFFNHSFIGHIIWDSGKYLTISQINQNEIEEEIQTPNGCFETILIQNGTACNLTQHLKRLQEGIQYLSLTPQIPNITEIESLLKINCIENSEYARLNIFCFFSNKKGGYRTIMRVAEYEKTPATNPITLMLNETSFNPPEEVRKAGIKTMNYANYRSATQKAIEAGHWDTILWDSSQKLLEGGRSTLLVYTQNKWVTPINNIVKGTVREKLLQLGLIKSEIISVEALKTAKFVCVCNALNGVRFVKKIIKENQTFYELTNMDEIYSIIHNWNKQL